MKIEQVKIDKLIPYARNSRTHSDAQVAQIAASIKEFGFTNPVLIDETGSIIAGHGRVMAARKLAIADVPSIRLTHLTEAQKKAYIIADNKLALNAGWDDEMLAVELSDLKDMGFDLDLTGFSTDEIAALLAPTGTEGLTDEDAVPEVPEAPVTVLGDVWLLGKHRVMCGDSTSIDAVEKLMAGWGADMCFTSPPYGAGSVAKLRDHYVRGAKKRESFYETHEDNASEWFDLMCGWYDAIRPSVGSVICNVQMLADNKRHIVKWLADRSGDLVDVAIWDKGHAAPQMQAGILSNSFEFLFVFGGNGSRSIPFSDFHGTEQNIVRISPKGKNEFAGVHRAVMPVELVEWVIKLCSTAKSFVDPFGGTGTTLIACEKTGRINRSMELDPKYCDVIVQRWQEFTGQTATLEETGKPFISLKKAA